MEREGKTIEVEEYPINNQLIKEILIEDDQEIEE